MITKSLSLENKNTCFGLVAILCWSFSALGAILLKRIPLFELLFSQFLLGFLITLVRYSYSRNKATFFNFSKLDLLVASLLVLANQGCYCAAFRYAPPIQVDLINYLWPTMLVLASALLPKEKFCFAYAISCAICVFGIYILLSPGEHQVFSSDYAFGYLLALGAALSWTSYSLYTRYRKSSSSNCLTTSFCFSAFICLLVHLNYETPILPNTEEVVIILFLGVLQAGLSFNLWERSMKLGKVRILGLASYAIPVLSVFVLVLFNKAVFTPKMALATLAITAAPLVPMFKSIFTRAEAEPISKLKNA